MWETSQSKGVLSVVRMRYVVRVPALLEDCYFFSEVLFSSAVLLSSAGLFSSAIITIIRSHWLLSRHDWKPIIASTYLLSLPPIITTTYISRKKTAVAIWLWSSHAHTCYKYNKYKHHFTNDIFATFRFKGSLTTFSTS